MASDDPSFKPQLERKIPDVVQFLKKKLDCKKVMVSEPDNEGDWVSFDSKTHDGLVVRVTIVDDGVVGT